jgi:hypothetical protein
MEAGDTAIVLTWTVAVTLNVAPAASVIKIVVAPAFVSPTTVTVDPEIDALTMLVSELLTEYGPTPPRTLN